MEWRESNSLAYSFYNTLKQFEGLPTQKQVKILTKNSRRRASEPSLESEVSRMEVWNCTKLPEHQGSGMRVRRQVDVYAIFFLQSSIGGCNDGPCLLPTENLAK
eukprot:scaffold1231_cov107-Cylindrotheca_fusiformis.AAC.20